MLYSPNFPMLITKTMIETYGEPTWDRDMVTFVYEEFWTIYAWLDAPYSDHWAVYVVEWGTAGVVRFDVANPGEEQYGMNILEPAFGYSRPQPLWNPDHVRGSWEAKRHPAEEQYQHRRLWHGTDCRYDLLPEFQEWVIQ